MTSPFVTLMAEPPDAASAAPWQESQPEDNLLPTSPYLQASNPKHRQRVLQLACEAGVVMLNGTLIR